MRVRRKSRPHHLPPPEAADVVVDGVEAGGEEGVEGVEELQRTQVGLTGIYYIHVLT